MRQLSSAQLADDVYGPATLTALEPMALNAEMAYHHALHCREKCSPPWCCHRRTARLYTVECPYCSKLDYYIHACINHDYVDNY